MTRTRQKTCEYPVVHFEPPSPKTQEEARGFIAKYGYKDMPGHPEWKSPFETKAGGGRRKRNRGTSRGPKID